MGKAHAQVRRLRPADGSGALDGVALRGGQAFAASGCLKNWVAASTSCPQGCGSRRTRAAHAANLLSAPVSSPYTRACRAHRSDAILSCPLCFTTLCIDCQQHDKYDNQFRAMFVMNCR